MRPKCMCVRVRTFLLFSRFLFFPIHFSQSTRYSGVRARARVQLLLRFKPRDFDDPRNEITRRIEAERGP